MLNESNAIREWVHVNLGKTVFEPFATTFDHPAGNYPAFRT